jgi:hypothetical protein
MMQNIFSGVLIGLLVAAVVMVTWRLARRGRGKPGQATAPTIQSFVTDMRAVGELSVFRIMTKEVITKSDHWFGEFGRKHLRWLLSEQKITLIMDFDVDFRYDLTDPAFKVSRTGPDSCRITLPPCRHEVFLRDMRFLSEDSPELLPLLMPEIVNRFFTGGFSVDAKNQLIDETRKESRRFAADLVRRVEAEAQASAIRTLSTLAQGLEQQTVDYLFTPSPEFQATVDSSQLEKRLQLAVDATDPADGRWD